MCHPRLATESDLERIHDVITDAYEKYLTRMDRPPAPVLRDYKPHIENGFLWVIGDPIIGLVSLSPEKDYLLLQNIAVHPSAQGKGYGRKLMEFAEFRAHELKLERIRLYTNEVMLENIGIYSHLGYVEVGRGLDEGYKRVFMEKTLSNATKIGEKE